MSNLPTNRGTVALIILDGWGLSPHPERVAEEGNATLMARTPVIVGLLATYPWSTLTPAGEAVGLPEGQMGNSEVGHLNLGAGRIVYQDFTKITRAIRDGSFFTNPVFADLIARIKSGSNRLHLLGLCSDGGVHSHLEHLYALVELARRNAVGAVYLHCFMDGRDTSPTGGERYVREILAQLEKIGTGKIATITGRYYAMDRDKRWERTEKAYRALFDAKGEKEADDPAAALKEWYAAGKTDEFIPPTIIRNAGVPLARQAIQDGDGVIFFNFRSDRARQLTRAITEPAFDGFARGRTAKVHYVCMTEFDETFDLPIAFPKQPMTNLLGHVLAAHGRTQLRCAETEKYPHVTFFFNGGVEAPLRGEERKMAPSPKVATYDLKPEMSAYELTENTLELLRNKHYDLLVLNYANPDMVGHTGCIPAAVRACEVVDECLGKLLEDILERGGCAIVTADHGNAERMLTADGKPHTAHTTNRVRWFYVGADHERFELSAGILADVAPTLLFLLGLPVPAEMTGKCLLKLKNLAQVK